MNIRLKSACIFLLLLLLEGSSAHAQYLIRGRITDQAGKPLSGAVVLLENAGDSSLVSTGLPDSAGAYMLTADHASGRQVRATAPGYTGEVRPLTDTMHPKIIMDFSLRAGGTALEGVTVSGRKPLFERQADRTIFHVANSITAAGGNALDAIRKAPGVTVKAGDNVISLAGKSEVQVLVNGRLLQLSGEDLANYLQAIPADNLEQIEVITTPPARYDAAGNSGLLNLVLKKNRRNGLNGEVRAGYEQAGYGKGIGGGTIHYRKDKLDVYANVAYFNGTNDINERLYTPYPGQLVRLIDHYRRQTGSLQYSLGADYQLRPHAVLGVQFTGSDFRRIYYEDINNRAEGAGTGALDSLIHTDATGRVANTNNSLNVNYEWTIDTAGKKLTLNANRLWYNAGRSKDLDTRSYDGPTGMPMGMNSINRNQGDQQIGITAVQADLELPGKWANISLGGKVSFADNDSRNQFLYYDNGIYYNNPAVSNAFTYRERIQALYISARKSRGRWEFQGGLRGELTQTSGYSHNLNQANTSHYFNLFPTAYLQYKINDDHVLNATYSKRINRPGYRALDPFRAYNSPNSYTEGNPFLRPSFAHNTELNFVLKGRYTFTGFYQYEEAHFGQVFLIDTLHQAQDVRWDNFANTLSYGASFTASLTPLKGWELQVQGGGYMQQINSGYYTAQEQSYRLPSWYLVANSSISFNKSKTLLGEVNIFCNGREQSDFLYLDPRGSIDAGIKALFLEKKLIVSLNAADLLATDRTRGINKATGQVLDSYFDGRNVLMMVQYKFGNRKVPAKRERSTGIEDEKSRT